jgi:hypothetical protein
VGLTTPHSKKTPLLRKSNKGKGWIELAMMDGKGLNELVTEKMEGYCSICQSPQRAVVRMEEEEEKLARD